MGLPTTTVDQKTEELLTVNELQRRQELDRVYQQIGSAYLAARLQPAVFLPSNSNPTVLELRVSAEAPLNLRVPMLILQARINSQFEAAQQTFQRLDLSREEALAVFDSVLEHQEMSFFSSHSSIELRQYFEAANSGHIDTHGRRNAVATTLPDLVPGDSTAESIPRSAHPPAMVPRTSTSGAIQIPRPSLQTWGPNGIGTATQVYSFVPGIPPTATSSTDLGHHATPLFSEHHQYLAGPSIDAPSRSGGRGSSTYFGRASSFGQAPSSTRLLTNHLHRATPTLSGQQQQSLTDYSTEAPLNPARSSSSPFVVPTSSNRPPPSAMSATDPVRHASPPFSEQHRSSAHLSSTSRLGLAPQPTRFLHRQPGGSSFVRGSTRAMTFVDPLRQPARAASSAQDPMSTISSINPAHHTSSQSSGQGIGPRLSARSRSIRTRRGRFLNWSSRAHSSVPVPPSASSIDPIRGISQPFPQQNNQSSTHARLGSNQSRRSMVSNGPAESPSSAHIPPSVISSRHNFHHASPRLSRQSVFDAPSPSPVGSRTEPLSAYTLPQDHVSQSLPTSLSVAARVPVALLHSSPPASELHRPASAPPECGSHAGAHRTSSFSSNTTVFHSIEERVDVDPAVSAEGSNDEAVSRDGRNTITNQQANHTLSLRDREHLEHIPQSTPILARVDDTAYRGNTIQTPETGSISVVLEQNDASRAPCSPPVSVAVRQTAPQRTPSPAMQPGDMTQGNISARFSHVLGGHSSPEMQGPLMHSDDEIHNAAKTPH
ncbi:hypothetical protein BP6252_01864 [Coleophoma cylindrospora]|uniref:Uncharacterized protein n=1 Tax=Coleophoma cylindrospora TaxID=1849047 RepID=A0A3D8SDU5_9HELO|nr:hypothetical protein BP6252_01864 [Coleophoma cylindrospora]